MSYRIYTENKNIDNIKAIVTNYFQGFTIIETKGYWNNKEESSIIIEIIEDPRLVDNTIHNKVATIAEEIKLINEQECVLVVQIHTTATFV